VKTAKTGRGAGDWGLDPLDGHVADSIAAYAQTISSEALRNVAAKVDMERRATLCEDTILVPTASMIDEEREVLFNDGWLEPPTHAWTRQPACPH
jgi:hypothetical protein